MIVADPADSVKAGLLQQARGGVHIEPVRPGRVLYRQQHPRHCRQVEHRVGAPLDHPGHDGRIAQVPDDGADIAAGKGPPVRDRDIGAGLQERADQPPPDEAGPAGHKDPGTTLVRHGCSIHISCQLKPGVPIKPG